MIISFYGSFQFNYASNIKKHWTRIISLFPRINAGNPPKTSCPSFKLLVSYQFEPMLKYFQTARHDGHLAMVDFPQSGSLEHSLTTRQSLPRPWSQGRRWPSQTPRPARSCAMAATTRVAFQLRIRERKPSLVWSSSPWGTDRAAILKGIAIHLRERTASQSIDFRRGGGKV